MNDQDKREKVINGLECCLGDTRADLPNLCRICPYAHGSYATQTCVKKLRKDAIDLLKAQEPVKPVFERIFMSDIEIYDCGKCGTSLGAKGIAKYCMKCGQKVKWE